MTPSRKERDSAPRQFIKTGHYSSPPHPFTYSSQQHSILTMHLVYSLLLLFSAAAVLVQGDYVSSKAIFTGVDNSDPNPSRDDVYEPNNIVTLTAIVLERFANSADFQPKNKGLFENGHELASFQGALKDFPGFTSKEDIYLGAEMDDGGHDQLKKAFAEAYAGRSNNPDAVASAFVEQIPRSTDSSFSGYWLLTLLTIHGEESGKVKVDIAVAFIEISVDKAGLVSIPKQGVYISVDRHEVDHITLLLSLSIVPKWDDFEVVKVSALVDLLTTPKPSNQLLDAWLFGSDHACEEKSIRSKHALRRQRLYTLSQLRMDY
ncbi:MAG: hypothetical protein J3Q66DRAFT_392861 [Benniella sp.]|nr:MAG: hypothetical protein J3Q66DRAFT_392861 [Benniella sp.]